MRLEQWIVSTCARLVTRLTSQIDVHQIKNENVLPDHQIRKALKGHVPVWRTGISTATLNSNTYNSSGKYRQIIAAKYDIPCM